MYKRIKHRHSVKRKQNSVHYILFAFFVSISIGYAYLTSALDITGSSAVSKNTWDIHFENFIVTEGSVETTDGVKFNDTDTTIDFNVALDLPFQFYEFKVDIINNGTINANLTDFTMTELTEEQKKYFMFNVTYDDGSAIVDNRFLEAGSSHTLLVRVEYLKYQEALLPESDQFLDLKIKFIYEQDNGLTKNFMDRILANAKPDTFVDFSSRPSSTNGEGLMIKQDTMNDAHPIYYFRGNVDNNNVKWANHCWKILRTTSTGGVKLIYNGTPQPDGSCSNSDKETMLEYYGTYNSDSSPAGVGYMYGKTLSSSRFDITKKISIMNTTSYSYNNTSSSPTQICYSDEVTWNESSGIYNLISPVCGTTLKKNTYTCGGNATGCSSIKYVIEPMEYTNGSTNYIYYTYKYLSNGNLSDSLTTNITICTKKEKVENINKLNTCNTYSLNDVSKKDLSRGYMCPDYVSTTCEKYYQILFPQYTSVGSNKLYYGYSYVTNDYYLYANNVSYADGTYTLINPVSYAWAESNSSEEMQKYPYTCTGSSNSCSSIKYIINYGTMNVMEYMTFTNGELVTTDLLNAMFTNTTSSNAKTEVEKWFDNNLTNYLDNIEDVVYCNDRSNSGLDENNVFKFNSNMRYKSNQIDLTCKNMNDSFSKTTEVGNGLLNYPIGLITYDEAKLSGTSNSFLNESNYYMTMTPARNNEIFTIGTTIYRDTPNTYRKIRPVVSIKGDFRITGGEGTEALPYTIK